MAALPLPINTGRLGNPAGGFDFNALFSNPLFNIGTGLLAAGLDSPTSLGQGLARGLQMGQAQQGLAMQNQLQRERIQAAAASREDAARQREAVADLIAIMTGGGTTPAAASGVATQAQDPAEVGALAQGAAELGVTPPPTAVATSTPGNTALMTAMARAFPQQFAQQAFQSVFQRPQGQTSQMRNFQNLIALGVPRDEAITRAFAGGTTINVGDRTLDKPLSVADLNKLQDPRTNQAFPVGTTMREAQAAGAVPITPERQKALDATEGFTDIFNQIEDLALGQVNPDTGEREGGIFTDIQPGFASRAGAGLRFAIDNLTGEDPQVEQFEALTGGTLSNLAKLLGERGALAEGDVARVANLLPQIRDEFLLPDTRESAQRKLGQLRGILDRGVKRLRGNLLSGPRRRLLPRQNRNQPTVVDFKDLPV